MCLRPLVFSRLSEDCGCVLSYLIRGPCLQTPTHMHQRPVDKWDEQGAATGRAPWAGGQYSTGLQGIGPMHFGRHCGVRRVGRIGLLEWAEEGGCEAFGEAICSFAVRALAGPLEQLTQPPLVGQSTLLGKSAADEMSTAGKSWGLTGHQE